MAPRIERRIAATNGISSLKIVVIAGSLTEHER
jgi:hypothetical protein